ncbi:MAG: dTDP-4-dehydrorhamnose reductase [Armatimonadetes bacterium]|nr:dTDP-4-dehydrorhamnose reductase [Armatimonadota bacterium]NIM24149.1 dTDP-4-dehydrorhamnose reductase [Armatimonadota bacterium]NIM68008.1 dTDP-4-dehydrorhamnose reductase [Armatimonadota bacterium]NIM76503.1 dTDP-4-dehydrorhamnose reductase [Armatimonadota bacterium]NIN06242.1 dTDP-4-dehydrorhamnose reductase [Armatimonadota bacterium]
MKVLVTGAKGMLGTDLCARLGKQHEVIPLDLPELDVTETASVFARLEATRPEMVIHCAAYTHVDGCERDPAQAFRVNSFGTWNVASACQKIDAALTYISTDFVFDGEKGEPYDEFDKTNPISVYGRSKLAGEEVIRALLSRYLIIRSAWLFGVHGKNFVRTVLHRAKEEDTVKVVADQMGCPTFTVDLAEAVAGLLESPLFGIYHITNSGACSWAQFAQEILRQAGLSAQVVPIAAAEWDSPTRRPKDSRLRHLALEMQGRDNLRFWQEALADFLGIYRDRF